MEDNKSTIVSEPSAAYDSTSYVMPRSSLISMLSSVGIEDIPMAIRYLVDKLAAAQRKETVDKSAHIWDDYELSAEIIAMAPAKRKSIYGDYDAELTEILEEKYKGRYFLTRTLSSISTIVAEGIICQLLLYLIWP